MNAIATLLLLGVCCAGVYGALRRTGSARTLAPEGRGRR